MAKLRKKLLPSNSDSGDKGDKRDKGDKEDKEDKGNLTTIFFPDSRLPTPDSRLPTPHTPHPTPFLHPDSLHSREANYDTS
ncbi:hypothetical protein DSM107010_12860 [Chroococcidiopsis cubana SAG 39.79]|uniref:Uncharacterized protein n=1 Tax=Chroococcidiopsis cubana SAG 39.79 TaxID=388085 RepID=A0AB37UPU7_9CYAN|nr:hypothetical protein DSM107010_12860 [Chroococcidiopsis cubana SAG 39.79]